MIEDIQKNEKVIEWIQKQMQLPLSNQSQTLATGKEGTMIDWFAKTNGMLGGKDYTTKLMFKLKEMLLCAPQEDKGASSKNEQDASLGGSINPGQHQGIMLPFFQIKRSEGKTNDPLSLLPMSSLKKVFKNIVTSLAHTDEGRKYVKQLYGQFFNEVVLESNQSKWFKSEDNTTISLFKGKKFTKK